MSDTENVTEVEVETQPEPTAMEVNLSNFVDAIQVANFNNAKDLFDDMLNSKMSDAMEAEKVAVAQTVFNGGDPSEDEIEEYDVEYSVEWETEETPDVEEPEEFEDEVEVETEVEEVEDVEGDETVDED